MADTQTKDLENTILMELKDGTVTIELLPDVAPLHCERSNMEDNFNLRAAGTGGSKLPNLRAEFSKLPHDRGTIGAARSQNPDSANSQFFINFSDNHFLNGQYTVYGRVTSGMEHVDAITRGEPAPNPDRMISMKVAADA